MAADTKEVLVQFVDKQAADAAVRASHARSIRIHNVIVTVERYSATPVDGPQGGRSHSPPPFDDPTAFSAVEHPSMQESATGSAAAETIWAPVPQPELDPQVDPQTGAFVHPPQASYAVVSQGGSLMAASGFSETPSPQPHTGYGPGDGVPPAGGHSGVEHENFLCPLRNTFLTVRALPLSLRACSVCFCSPLAVCALLLPVARSTSCSCACSSSASLRCVRARSSCALRPGRYRGRLRVAELSRTFRGAGPGERARRARVRAVSYTHLTLPTTPYV